MCITFRKLSSSNGELDYEALRQSLISGVQHSTSKLLLLRPNVATPATYSVAFEEHIQVLGGLAVLVVIEGALVDGVLAVRLGTVAAIEAFLSQSL